MRPGRGLLLAMILIGFAMPAHSAPFAGTMAELSMSAELIQVQGERTYVQCRRQVRREMPGRKAGRHMQALRLAAVQRCVMTGGF